MRNTIMLILTVYVLLYVSVILDVPVLRQCIGFVYLTFLPGFIIFRALRIKTDSFAVELSLSVTLSIAFVMFTGLLVNTTYPLLAAPLSTIPLVVTISALTLVIFILSRRKEIGSISNTYSQFFHAGIDTRGAILCAISISLLSLSIVGALTDSVFLLVFVFAGIAAIFATSIFLHKSIPSGYYMFVLFAVSLSLLLQMSLISRHIMGWDIFGEYFVFEKMTRAKGYWNSPGALTLSRSGTDDLRSILSVTILPTAYSNVLNMDSELILKTVFPFIFCFVPILLFKTYESQSARIVALLSVFFFIADPLNWYGLEALSLVREMITYLFLSAMILCFVRQDMDLTTRRVLVITFSAGLAVSHYSLAFLSAFLIVFVFLAMRIVGRKDPLMNLALVLCIVGMTFGWYMYVAAPPLNRLSDTFRDVQSRLTQDIFTTENRVDPVMSNLSPTTQALSLYGLIHKIIIYVSEFFVVVGAIVLAVKPKEFKFYPLFRWMAMFAAFLLFVCLAVPNVAPALNFSRFYRYAMIFLAPLFILGGVYFLGLFKKIHPVRSARSRFALRDLRLLMLTGLLVVFFLFRSGFVNTVAGDVPYSYSLDFNRMKKSIFTTGGSLYYIYVPEQDLYSARWLAARIGSDSTVYADSGMGVFTLVDFTNLIPQNVSNIVRWTLTESARAKSCTYLRSFNVLAGEVHQSEGGYFNLSVISHSLSQNDKIYSNGNSTVFYAP